MQLTLPLFDLPPAAPPASVRAPAGMRSTMLCEQPVHYELRRSRRRTIGFVIDDRGLRVTAPRWVPMGEIERALQEKARWILRKLVEWRDHEARRERVAIRWHDGATLRFLGTALTLSVDPGARGVARDGDLLRVGLPPRAGEEQLRDRVQSWLQARAREVFAERIPVFAERLGRTPSRWALSSARTRWGSCTPDGAIRLNWRLVHFPMEIVDYVIAHELAHLRELNHGPRFWSTVGELFPDFERARAWLRDFPDDMPVG
ncbi:MAG TPA: SprT family zinc-dependent metalloprotease [Burkholderiaceae bacterium]|nr:SprT family zinc-dependent metalloprotease [Burkholderiaceae bacterium]